MYYDMLVSGNNEFTNNINRSFPRWRTKRLDAVVAKLGEAQKTKSEATLLALLTAMDLWRTSDPKEFANRGGGNGVAYRLWMETKQALRNNFNRAFAKADPPIPAMCPGTTLLGIYVPESKSPQQEICHCFAYRWALAAGKLSEVVAGRPGTRDDDCNAASMTPILYPDRGGQQGYLGYPVARAGGQVQIQTGDIIGMFAVPPAAPAGGLLGHSLIAKSPTVWFSANNAGTFGVGTGRSEIDTTTNFGQASVTTYDQLGLKIATRYVQSGWEGNGNMWVRRTDGVAVAVIYRRIP